MNLLLLFISLSVAAPQGPCARKLLATGDRVEDTTQFTMHLEMLIHERIIRVEDLELFAAQLELGKMNNPILNRNSNKNLNFHFAEFQKLIASDTLDLEIIKLWTKEVILKNKLTEKQKEKAQLKTKEIPILTASDGAMVFKFNHPHIGPAVKILLPGGRFDNPKDWDPMAWAISPMRDKYGDLQKLSVGGVDVQDSTLVSKNSPARKACIELGGGADLPSSTDYFRLILHFRFKDGQFLFPPGGIPSERRRQFQQVFPELRGENFWTSTVEQPDSSNALLFSGNDLVFYNSPGMTPRPFFCVAPLEVKK